MRMWDPAEVLLVSTLRMKELTSSQFEKIQKDNIQD